MRSDKESRGLVMSLLEAKQQLREAAKTRRRAAHEAGAAAAAQALVERFERHVTVPPGAVVSGYWPGGSELDDRPVLERLAAHGHRAVLPVVIERNAPLIFRVWRPGDPVVKGNGAWVPAASAPVLEPDLLLVPLVGFDRHGTRLGQGAGYYDRTLLKLRAVKAITAIGIGYAVQELSDIPTGPYDQPLDAVLTEAGLIEIG
jgi:5-formyltetrahydrofolate cyclo-ligase